MANQVDDPEKGLNIVRLALIAGTAIFGPVAWMVASMEDIEVFTGNEVYIWIGLTVFFLSLFGGILLARSKWRVADTFEEKRSANIIGWALAESAALIGGLYMMVGGTPAFFGAGFALQLLASFVLLPVPEH
ncbi:MAG: hypothetical protein ABEL51_05390 [Salinibacter sp.]